MKIELVQNKVYFNNGTEKKEIHPFWLRERVNNQELLDKNTGQRLYDPSDLNHKLKIKKALIKFLGSSIDLSTCVSAARLKIPIGLNRFKIFNISLLLLISCLKKR